MRVNNSDNTLNFKEVKSVFSDVECNKLIIEGWQILHVGATHVDNNGYNSKTTFIMGNPNKETTNE